MAEQLDERKIAEKKKALENAIANIDKAQRASNKLLAAIATLRENGGYEKLDEKLRAVCDAREANPGFTMAQLAEALGISKSGLNHRIEKILEEANNG